MTSLGRVVDGKYRVLYPLGKGGMGAVWVAEHIALGSKVAIKFINAPIASVERARKRFKREARAAAALRGPNVVQVFDYGIDQGDPYIVMELLAGETLADRLERERLTVEETIEVARQVANALTRAHEQGIVHRDLKPANIFLVNDESTLSVKLLDFGLAKIVPSHGVTIEHLTQPGNPVGTLHYMSPEQLRGGKIDARTDVWALAMVVYECLTGRLPFGVASKRALRFAVMEEPLLPPSTFAMVPDGLDAWFERGTERARSDRESSARRLAEDLSQLMAGLSGHLELRRSRRKLPRISAYPSTNDSPTERVSSSVPVAINGRRDLDHIALIAKLSRNTGILWTRHKGELGEWIRLTIHFEGDERGHSTLAKVLRVNEEPNERPNMWAYEVTVRFAQPLEGMAQRLRAAT